MGVKSFSLKFEDKAIGVATLKLSKFTLQIAEEAFIYICLWAMKQFFEKE